MSALTGPYRPASIVAISLAFLVVGIVPAHATAPLPDTTWGVRGKVYALAQGPSGRVYVGGKFGELLATDGPASQPAQSLAAFAPVTGRPITTWRPSITLGALPGTVDALALSPDASVLYVGGKFDAVNGLPVHNFAAISTSTADLVPGFSLPDINVTNAILVSPATGEIYLGGSFRRVNRHLRQNLAALLPDGTLDSSWTPSADDNVRALRFAADRQTIFVGGHFTTMNGQPRQSVARLNLDGTLNEWAVPSGVVTPPQTAWDIAVQPTRVYVGFGNKQNYYAAFGLDDGSVGDEVWLNHATGNVESVALGPQGSRLFIGGHFGTAHKRVKLCDGFALHGLASVRVETGEAVCTWLPHLYPDIGNFVGARTLLVDPVNQTVWVGGFFTQVCDQAGTNCVKQHSLSRYAL
jgi:hypothetical protein